MKVKGIEWEDEGFPVEIKDKLLLRIDWVWSTENPHRPHNHSKKSPHKDTTIEGSWRGEEKVLKLFITEGENKVWKVVEIIDSDVLRIIPIQSFTACHISDQMWTIEGKRDEVNKIVILCSKTSIDPTLPGWRLGIW